MFAEKINSAALYDGLTPKKKTCYEIVRVFASALSANILELSLRRRRLSDIHEHVRVVVACAPVNHLHKIEFKIRIPSPGPSINLEG